MIVAIAGSLEHYRYRCGDNNYILTDSPVESTVSLERLFRQIVEHYGRRIQTNRACPPNGWFIPDIKITIEVPEG